MELKPATTGAWIPGLAPRDIATSDARAVLLFGPDQGGVFEFARLVAQRSGPPEVYAADGANPADIAALLGSGSLFDGASTVRLDGADDRFAGKLETILDAPFDDGARLILTAGELRTSSKLRKLFQKRADCLAAPLYLLRERDLTRVSTGIFHQFGLSLDRAAGAMLPARLSGDRARATRACETVALHAMGAGRDKVLDTDIRAILDTVDESGLSGPLDHALDAEPQRAIRAMDRCLNSGESFVGMLRVFSARLFRLREMAASGLAPAQAVAQAKPPVFWTEKQRTISALSRLRLSDIDRLLEMVDATEYRIIEDGVPAAIAMPTLALEFARIAMKAHRRGR